MFMSIIITLTYYHSAGEPAGPSGSRGGGPGRWARRRAPAERMRYY